MRHTGALDFIILLSATVLGALNGPIWGVALVAALLLATALVENAELNQRLVRAGAMSGALSGVASSAMVSLGFAGLCFFIGRVLSVFLPT